MAGIQAPKNAKNIDLMKRNKDKPVALYAISSFYFQVEIIESKNKFYIAGVEVNKSDLAAFDPEKNVGVGKVLMKDSLPDQVKKLLLLVSSVYKLQEMSKEQINPKFAHLKEVADLLSDELKLKGNYSYASLLDQALISTQKVASYDVDNDASLEFN